MPNMFQQRHFEALAQIMQDNCPKPGDKVLTHSAYWQQLISAMVEVFKASNPHFDEARFRAACMPGNPVRGNRRQGPAMPYVQPRN